MDGQWEVQLQSWSPAKLDESVNGARAYAAVITALTDQVKSGAFASYQELDAARTQKLRALSRALSASRPTTTAAGPSPKDAVIELFERMAANDLAGAKDVVMEGGGSHESLQVWISLVPASNELAKAAKERFGDAAEQKFPRGERFLDALKTGAQVEMEQGDAAVVLDPASGMRFPVTRINGKWKVQFPQQSPEQLAKQLKYSAEHVALLTALARQVREGAFHSLDELVAAHERGMKQMRDDSVRPPSPTSALAAR
jgi:hypothetical protein